jgi:hypothetical protein
MRVIKRLDHVFKVFNKVLEFQDVGQRAKGLIFLVFMITLAFWVGFFQTKLIS